MFDQLSERLQQSFRKVQGKANLTDDNMSDAIRDVRRALLEADVNLQVIKRFIDRIKDRAEGEGVTKGVDPGQQLVKIIHDELVTLLGKEHQGLNLERPAANQPALIMLFGLQGSGKTTSAAKLALNFKKQGKSPCLIAADVYRPAAINQLEQLGKQLDIPVFSQHDTTDVAGIVADGLAQASGANHDIAIIDTAGRLQIDSELMAELLLLERTTKPANKLLVVDAMTGQEALNVAEAFDSQLGMTGMILTKTDGDARGGAALSVAEMTGKPILYVGTSEKPDGLEVFHPDRMASRILGMGDVVSLVEKAQEAVDLDEAKRLEESIRKQTFSFEDFLGIQKQLKMLGSLGGILDMLPIPGLDKATKNQISNVSEEQLTRCKVMIQSMTVAERQNPDLLNNNKSRLSRIAKGCGYKDKDVSQFVLQFNQMKLVMKQLTGMTDNAQKEAAKQSAGADGSFGFHMPRNMRKKAKKNKSQQGMPGGFPNMPGMPKMPGGKGGMGKGMPKLPFPFK
jgi:signal recognition particle subunit SRP54